MRRKIGPLFLGDCFKELTGTDRSYMVRHFALAYVRTAHHKPDRSPGCKVLKMCGASPFTEMKPGFLSTNEDRNRSRPPRTLPERKCRI